MKVENKGEKIVMAIGDMHFPFQHPDTIPFLRWAKAKFKPNSFVCIGDEIDAHALSDYDHDPDGMSAGDELLKALEGLKQIYKLFPKMLVCTSNHTARPYRKALKHGIPRAFLRDYHEFLEAPKGWQWAEKWEVDGVVFEHGEGVSGAAGALKAATGNSQSTVIGHLHSWAGIQYLANPRHLIYGFNVGCLIDKDAYAFAYGKSMKAKPVIGVGFIIKGVPLFVPMLLGKDGRWINK